MTTMDHTERAHFLAQHKATCRRLFAVATLPLIHNRTARLTPVQRRSYDRWRAAGLSYGDALALVIEAAVRADTGPPVLVVPAEPPRAPPAKPRRPAKPAKRKGVYVQRHPKHKPTARGRVRIVQLHISA